MMVAHMALFLYVRKRIARKKRVLEKENAELRRDLMQTETKVNYYKTRCISLSKQLTTEKRSVLP